ncbi:hypothetical protein QJU87_04120 [Pasteurella skyensis]|uniref:hypothetical protein n=1 Tax=Phocoenobacter skyensis TaxID=97481 RepID=UPI0027575A95|nr:hypothetical protein [Pasteurella skyensis]MDP8189050.1 hypothetical protein [Pasteurella skyensis]
MENLIILIILIIINLILLMYKPSKRKEIERYIHSEFLDKLVKDKAKREEYLELVESFRHLDEREAEKLREDFITKFLEQKH